MGVEGRFEAAHQREIKAWERSWIAQRPAGRWRCGGSQICRQGCRRYREKSPDVNVMFESGGAPGESSGGVFSCAELENGGSGGGEVAEFIGASRGRWQTSGGGRGEESKIDDATATSHGCVGQRGLVGDGAELR